MYGELWQQGHAEERFALGARPELAEQITSGEVGPPEIGYSTFYHADYVSPHWKSAMNK